MCSFARVARRCSFVSSATSFRGGMRAHGVCTVSSTLVTWFPFLVEELLAGTEPVHEEVPGAVQSVQETLLTLAVMPVLSHERAGDRVILLFHMRVVILVIGTGMGERDTSGMTESVETIHVPFLCQESEGGGRTHLEEKLPCLVLHMEMPMCGEVLHEEWHASCQTDRSQERACAPDRDQCLLHRRVIQGRTMLV